MITGVWVKVLSHLKCSPRPGAQPAHITNTLPLYSLPKAVKVTSKAILWVLNMFTFRKGPKKSVSTHNMTQRVKGLKEEREKEHILDQSICSAMRHSIHAVFRIFNNLVRFIISKYKWCYKLILRGVLLRWDFPLEKEIAQRGVSKK